jgi:N-acetyl-alpha-D-glucosaminyl L-malate synthase BshA
VSDAACRREAAPERPRAPSPGAGPRPAPCLGWRVGLVCYPSQGGSGIVATELARELAQRGHCAHVISYQAPFRLAGPQRHAQHNIAFHQVEVPTYPLFVYPPYTVALANKIAEVARYERLDLVHVHYAVPHAVSAALARAMLAPLPLPVIATLHGTDVTQTGVDPGIREALTWSLQQCDAVTAVSDALAARAREAFGLPEVRRLYNFIDPAVMRRRPNVELRARFAGPDDAVLMHASNFRPVKNVADVVRILAAVVEARPAVLLLCGDGPEAGTARRLARELGVEDRVHFVGLEDDMAAMLSIADVFLLPSTFESFGLAALEAMACEVPVVCSDAGGLPEVVVDGETGFLCPAGNVEAMARAVLRCLEPPRLARMRHQARRIATHRFGSARILPQVEALYAEVLARRAVRA